jgi:hypothetical protein
MRWLALLLVLAARAAGADEPVLALHADDGWWEDAFALDGAGGRLAVVRADPAGHLALELLDLGQRGAVLGRVPIGDAAPAAVAVLRAGLLVVTGPEARLYDPSGRPRAHFGPATDCGFADDAGRELITTYTRTAAGAEVAVYDAARPSAPLVRRTFPKAGPELTPLYWRDGYTRLVARRAGRYDRAADRRLPDTEAVVDVVAGRIVSDRPVTDPAGHARLLGDRSRHPNAATFVAIADGRLEAVTVDDRVVALDLGAPIAGYDPASLRVVPGRDGALFFGLTTGTALELFRFDPAAAEPGRPARLLRVPTGGRDVVWHVAGGRVALLRKPMTSGRGGTDLEILDLPR